MHLVLLYNTVKEGPKPPVALPERSKRVTYGALRRKHTKLRPIAETCAHGLGKVRKECSLMGLCRTSLAMGLAYIALCSQFSKCMFSHTMQFMALT